MCHTVTQGIRTSNTFIKYKSATTDKFYHKTQVNSVECWDQWDEKKPVKSKVPSINYPYFAKNFEFLL